MTDLRHLQTILLSMAKEVDDLCIKHNITYYLFGGNVLGAIRHKGFIPWDDDFDITLIREEYERFMDICRNELDKDKYFIEESGKEWPMCYSKIRLKDTYVKDKEEYDGIPENCKGIWIDVFPLEHARKSSIGKLWQYFCGKSLVANSLRVRGYKSAASWKKFIMGMSIPLAVNLIKNFITHQARNTGAVDSSYVCFMYGMTRFKNSFFSKNVFGNPVYVEYENIKLPIPEQYDYFLRSIYGDYMKLPPEDKRQTHISKIDFGKY